jgi:hypothetical protein
LDISGSAKIAGSTCLGVRFPDDASAYLEALNVTSYLDNLSRKLVAQNHRWPIRKLIVKDVEISTANSAGFDFDEHLALAGRWYRPVLQLHKSDTLLCFY